MLVRIHAVKPLLCVERDTRLTDHSSPRENSYPGKSRIEKRETIKAGQNSRAFELRASRSKRSLRQL